MTSCFGGSTPILGRKRITLLQPYGDRSSSPNDYTSNKIHLWRHSIVLALHYFQGMACYRSATLLEVMDTRSFWNMFVFSRVMYRQSCISEEHSNNSCFSMNKKKSVVTARLEPTPSIRCGLSFMSPPLYQLSYHSAEALIYKIYKYKREGYIWYIICIDTWTL